ncbi:MAG TPA: Crp/Fnr family transcriptional regulator [Chitinophagales bacterium]|nr:Crp/Fnr family transcriptional regulator [Chitinophagales bacterium]
MKLNPDLLLAWGANSKKYAKNEIVFQDGTEPKSYYQIVSGAVKMVNINSEGREFTQGYFYEGNSFGEPPLFIDETYPATAITLMPSVIMRLPKLTFLRLIDEYPALHKQVIYEFAQRIHNKATTARIIINNSPEERIIGFLENYKAHHKNAAANKILIPFTRQEIANFTGLRVETVIRTLTKMKEKKQVAIINRKLYY